MDVILLSKVENLGALGDKVSVRSGYARNYLIPQGKANLPPPTILQNLKHAALNLKHRQLRFSLKRKLVRLS